MPVAAGFGAGTTQTLNAMRYRSNGAKMVKLTPKLIDQELPEEDVQNVQKLLLPGRNIERVSAVGVTSVERCAGAFAQVVKLVAHADCSFEHLLEAHPTGSEPQ